MDDSLVTPSFSSVTSVFEQYGVIHVHDNPEVVGASRVEDHITRCAMQDVFELSTNTQAPALLCDPMSPPSEDEAEGKSAPSKKRTRGRTAAKDHNFARIVEHGRWRILIGQTPTTIRKKQWSKLKESEKCADGITLAQRVLRATPEERLTILKKMYRRDLDTGLHEKLDDILSKPADPLPDEPKKGGSSKKTVPKLQAGKSHPKKGPKKTRQSKPSTSKKQASMRKYIKRGVLYNDQDDTQPSTSSRKQPHGLDPVSSDDSSYDIGAKVSPAKVRATQRRRRGGLSGRNRTQQQNTVSFSMFDEEDDTAVLSVSRKVSVGRTESIKDKPGTSAMEDVDGLLQELGRKRTNEGIVGKSASAKLAPVTKRTKGASVSENKAANLSVLDDIFSEPDDSEKKKRKPPPRHGQRLRTEKTGSRNQQTNATGLAGSSRPNITRNPRASTSSDAFSDLMNDSTLADDEVDCFGEPTQWKKRHKVRKTAAKNVDRLLQETTDDYHHLFVSGRLVKKRQREKVVEHERGRVRCVEQVEVDRVGLRRTVSSEVDPSASLF
ncbi:DNA excision repair protein ERCC-6-like 2 [Littorina saxatilis]|uniref:DNA excision repair protein ERCC-6-like 2 n=1 Tax=Littorina saxatilis TaxID=31220 RepID=UPI0038B5C98F